MPQNKSRSRTSGRYRPIAGGRPLAGKGSGPGRSPAGPPRRGGSPHPYFPPPSHAGWGRAPPLGRGGSPSVGACLPPSHLYIRYSRGEAYTKKHNYSTFESSSHYFCCLSLERMNDTSEPYYIILYMYCCLYMLMSWMFIRLFNLIMIVKLHTVLELVPQ